MLSKEREKELPSCIKNIYNCQICKKPAIPRWPNGPTQPCDGTLHFCKFATSHTYPDLDACKQFNLQNFSCTHGGGSCSGFNTLWKRLKYGKLSVNGKQTEEK